MTVRLDPVASRIALPLPIRIRNQVLFVLVAVGGLAVVLLGFVGLAPNRLVSGSPMLLLAGAGAGFTAAIAALGAILLAASVAQPSKALHCATATSAALLLLVVLAAAGRTAAILAPVASAASRISLGPAFWVLVACAALSLADALQRLRAGVALRALAVIAVAAGIVLLAAHGTFDALSVAQEYASRRQVFADAVVRHIVLVGTSVGAALVLGLPLGVAAGKRSRLQGPLFAVLNTLQTIPSIALFGLLIVPLSALAAPRLGALGISGIGVTPAVIALVLYALLPVVRNTVVGLMNVDGASIEAGRGMGMSSRQIFWQIELPLSVPVLLAGVRIVTVQAIGLAVVAALIGAGGLGTFVFEGLGQYAVDLVLLGALPAILLALAADFALQSFATVLRRRFAR